MKEEGTDYGRANGKTSATGIATDAVIGSDSRTAPDAVIRRDWPLIAHLDANDAS